MEIINANLDKKLYSNHGFNSERDDYKIPQGFQTDIPKDNDNKRKEYIGK
jgi:hypothetical protein